MKPLDGAILLAEYGIRTFPTHGIQANGTCTCGKADCGSPGKHPISKGWQASATTDHEQLRALWEAHPSANLGIACGEASGVMVVDIDGEAGQQALMALEADNEPLPSTWTVRTGSGEGQHLYFRHRPGLGNKVRAVEGLDVRTDGGLVIAPPSCHISGNFYKWATGRTPATCELAEMPDWLFTALQADKRGRRVVVAASDDNLRDPQHWLSEYVTDANEGSRNVRGFDLACQLRDNCLSQGTATEGECIAIMRDYAQRVTQGGKHYTAAEALASWKSALSHPAREPAGAMTAYIPVSDAPVDDGPTELTTSDFTDIGNGRRLVNRFAKGELLFNRDIGKWLTWTGQYWQPDLDGAMVRKAAATMEAMYTLIPHVPKAQQAPLLKHIQKSLSMPRINGMIDAAATVAGITRPGADFDAQPYHLCVHNGVIDLRTGALLPFDKALLLSRQVAIEYDPGAQCPHWERFLGQVQPDPEIRDYLQRAAGYTLTADASEQCLFFLHGQGLNGKTTFVEVLSDMLGDYHGKTAAETIMAKKQGGGIPNDIAALCGKRMISASELSRYSRLNEGLIKDLTGGDAIQARFLNKEFFQFHLSAKIWLYGNERPRISGTNEGIWRRMRLIPWAVQVPETQVEAQIRGIDYWKDPKLRDRFKSELPGILAWAVRGCLIWQRDGLGKPAAVEDASSEYRTEQDALADFFESEVDMCPTAVCSKGDLWARYQIWAEKAGEKGHYTFRRFNSDIANRSAIKGFRGTGGVRSWVGLRLKPFGRSDVSDGSDTNFHELQHEEREIGGTSLFAPRVTSVTNPDNTQNTEEEYEEI